MFPLKLYIERITREIKRLFVSKARLFIIAFIALISLTLILLVVVLRPSRLGIGTDTGAYFVNASPIQVFSQLSSSNTSSFPSELDLRIYFISFTPELFQDATLSSACIKSISLTQITQYGYLSGSKNSEFHSVDKTLCFHSSEEYQKPIPIEWNIKITNDIWRSDYYRFPYDHLAIILEFKVVVDFFDNNGDFIKEYEIPARPQITTNVIGWEFNDVLDDGGTSYWVNLKRPALIRVLTPILLFLLYFLSMLILTIDSMSNALQVAVALVFGTWSVRQILIPEYLPEITMVDAILAINYGVIILSIIGLLILYKIEKGDRGNKNNNIEATASQFVSSVNSQIVHRNGCSRLSSVNNTKFVFYYNLAEAVNSGKHPCKTCKPKDIKSC